MKTVLIIGPYQLESETPIFISQAPEGSVSMLDINEFKMGATDAQLSEGLTEGSVDPQFVEEATPADAEEEKSDGEIVDNAA